MRRAVKYRRLHFQLGQRRKPFAQQHGAELHQQMRAFVGRQQLVRHHAADRDRVAGMQLIRDAVQQQLPVSAQAI